MNVKSLILSLNEDILKYANMRARNDMNNSAYIITTHFMESRIIKIYFIRFMKIART